MGRRRMYADDADKQRAYRRRGGDGHHQAAPETTQRAARETTKRATRAPAAHTQKKYRNATGKSTRGHDIAPRVAPVGASQGHSGGVYQHTAAAGLLVRVDGELAGGRVLATVLTPGQSNLTAGTAYPFRVDLLNEVTA